MEQSSDIVKNIVELRESLKLFDQRISQLKDTIRMVDQNNLDKYKEIKSVLQDLSASVSSDKSKILEIEDTLSRIEKQMERFARVQDVKVIEKYLSFVDPSRFLSKEDVIKIVDDYMSNKKWG